MESIKQAALSEVTEVVKEIVPPEILALKEALDGNMSLEDAIKIARRYKPRFNFKDWLEGNGLYNQPMEGGLELGARVQSAIHAAQTKLAEAFWLKGDNDKAVNIMEQTPAEFAGENLDNPHIIPYWKRPKIGEREQGIELGEVYTNQNDGIALNDLDIQIAALEADLPFLDDALGVGGYRFDPEGYAKLKEDLAKINVPKTELSKQAYLDQLNQQYDLRNDFWNSLKDQNWEDISLDDDFDALVQEFRESGQLVPN